MRDRERVDVSVVIEAGGHPGRQNHESRTSGREQCQVPGSLLRLVLPRRVLLRILHAGISPARNRPIGIASVASVLIRFDPRLRLTLKQTLFMTKSLRNGMWWPTIFVPRGRASARARLFFLMLWTERGRDRGETRCDILFAPRAAVSHATGPNGAIEDKLALRDARWSSDSGTQQTRYVSLRTYNATSPLAPQRLIEQTKRDQERDHTPDTTISSVPSTGSPSIPSAPLSRPNKRKDSLAWSSSHLYRGIF